MATNHKIIITGTGRAGTTFLVRLLTALGLPTGYDSSNWQKDYFPHCAAGLEHKLGNSDAPYIIKDPDLCVTLAGLLDRNEVVVDHALIPVRDLEAAALSRIHVGGANGDTPGGLIGTSSPPQQRAILAERFHELVHALVVHDVPHTFLLFPRFVQDADYAFKKLRIPFPSLDEARFKVAFREVSDPGLVHTYKPGVDSNGDAGVKAEMFRASERNKRRWRRARRITGWSALAASIAVIAGLRWPASAIGRSPDLHMNNAPPPTIQSGNLVPYSLLNQRALGPVRSAPAMPGACETQADFTAIPFSLLPPRTATTVVHPSTPRSETQPHLLSQSSE